MSGIYTYNYPRPAVTTDCILVRKNTKEVLLIKRKHNPFQGKWALPGGFVEIDEDLIEGAQRELFEETGIIDVDLKQFKTYGKPGRDPRGRTISVVYYAYINEEATIKAGDDASEVAWFNLNLLPPLGFDHELILSEFIASKKENK